MSIQTAASLPTLPRPPKMYEEEQKPQFAFAQLYDQVVLVQVPQAPPSPLTAVDIDVFRHEFVTLFRYSHSAAVHPSDIRILERLPDAETLHEEENGTVFLAKDLVARLSQWTRAGRKTGCVGGAFGMAMHHHHHANVSRRTSMPAQRRVSRY